MQNSSNAPKRIIPKLKVLEDVFIFHPIKGNYIQDLHCTCKICLKHETIFHFLQKRLFAGD